MIIYNGSLITPSTRNAITWEEKPFLLKQKDFIRSWKLKKEPLVSKTSVPGIFATGDVRFGPKTRISAAFGEGSMAIRCVRKYLQEM